MTSRIPHLRVAAVGAAAAVLTLTTAACASSTGGSGTPAGGSSTAGGSSSGSPSGGSSSGGSVGTASSISDLASQLIAATAHGTTVHITLSTSGGGTTADGAASGEGDIRTKDGGTSDAFSFEVGTGSIAVSMVYVDGAGYVKLPASEQTDPSKPWAKISSTSSNPVVKALSTAFDQVGSQTSLSQYAALVKGASNFKATGPTNVDGVAVQGYSFDVDPASLPNAKQYGSVISKIGPIPTTLAVDEQGRPVQVTEKIAVAGQGITTNVMFSKYGESVTFTAPPADQTSTG